MLLFIYSQIISLRMIHVLFNSSQQQQLFYLDMFQVMLKGINYYKLIFNKFQKNVFHINVFILSFSFSINLRAAGNIAFHLNPRLDRGYVVRNSKVKGSWEEEETCSSAASTGHVFKRQSYFHILIFCGPKEFQVMNCKKNI